MLISCHGGRGLRRGRLAAKRNASKAVSVLSATNLERRGLEGPTRRNSAGGPYSSLFRVSMRKETPVSQKPGQRAQAAQTPRAAKGRRRQSADHTRRAAPASRGAAKGNRQKAKGDRAQFCRHCSTMALAARRKLCSESCGFPARAGRPACRILKVDGKGEKTRFCRCIPGEPNA